MKWLKTLLYGIIFWVCLFLLSSGLLLFTGEIYAAGAGEVNLDHKVFVWLTELILTIVFTIIYFQKRKASFGKGLLFGFCI